MVSNASCSQTQANPTQTKKMALMVKVQIIRSYIHLKFVTGKEKTNEPSPAVGTS